MNIILASKSPRRKELLSQIDVKFECVVSDKEELITKTLPEEVVKELSLQKAEDVEVKVKEKYENALIIGADTIVSCDGEILGKPSDEEMAAKMLRNISGRTHKVYTGVTVIYYNVGERKIISFAECTEVFVDHLSEEDIQEYIATKEPMDKAGAYGIQGKFGKFVTKIDGDYNNVVGLPIARLFGEVRRVLGIDIVSGKIL